MPGVREGNDTREVAQMSPPYEPYEIPVYLGPYCRRFRIREPAERTAREQGLCFGLSTFGGWYVGTEENLEGAGIADLIRPSDLRVEKVAESTNASVPDAYLSIDEWLGDLQIEHETDEETDEEVAVRVFDWSAEATESEA